MTARWRRRLAGDEPNAKRHWRTKVGYYLALVDLLASGRPLPTWQSIVAAAQPIGHRSTFYEVIGPSARHSLLGELRAEPRIDAMQLLLCYRRPSAVAQLVDETKVWAYWPHREALSARLRGSPDLPAAGATELVCSAVAAWADGMPALAAALDHAPPLCAVEDLLAIAPGQRSAVSAFGLLADVLGRVGAERRIA